MTATTCCCWSCCYWLAARYRYKYEYEYKYKSLLLLLALLFGLARREPICMHK